MHGVLLLREAKFIVYGKKISYVIIVSPWSASSAQVHIVRLLAGANQNFSKAHARQTLYYANT